MSVSKDENIPATYDEVVIGYQDLQNECKKLRQENESLKKKIADHDDKDDDNDSVSSSSENEEEDDTIDEAWYAKYRELIACKQKHDHCKVSQKEGKLGNWVKFQRQLYVKYVAKKPSGLTPWKVDLLNKIGFYWGKQFGEPKIKKWEDWYGELEERVMALDVKPKSIAKDTELGKWVMSQRKQLKRFKQGKSSMINMEKAKLLIKLGL